MDNKIRDKFSDFSVEPPPHVWGGIQEQLMAKQKRKRMAYVGWISAAAVVVFAFIAGWYFNENSIQSVPQIVEQKVEETREDGDLIRKESEVLKPEEVITITENIQEPGSNSFIKKRSDIVLKNIAEKRPDTNIEIRKSNSLTLLERIESIFITDNQTVKLAVHTVSLDNINEFELTEADRILVAANRASLETDKKNESAWIVGAHISPGYSSYSANHEKEYSRNMSYSGTSEGGNVGGGFSVQYKTGKRWKVESGVYYSQNGQKSGTSTNVFALNQNTDYFAGPEPIDSEQPVFSNAVRLGASGIAMNSSAGVVNIKNAPQGALIASKSETPNEDFSNYLTTSGEFSQMFDIVEVPVYMRYRVLDKSVGVELLGGFNAGIIVGNNAYINNDYGKQNIGDIADISTFNLSGTVGIGISYALGKHFSLAVEPRINYFLNSINSNPDVSYKPYRIGVFTGVYYEF